MSPERPSQKGLGLHGEKQTCLVWDFIEAINEIQTPTIVNIHRIGVLCPGWDGGKINSISSTEASPTTEYQERFAASCQT